MTRQCFTLVSPSRILGSRWLVIVVVCLITQVAWCNSPPSFWSQSQAPIAKRWQRTGTYLDQAPGPPPKCRLHIPKGYHQNTTPWRCHNAIMTHQRVPLLPNISHTLHAEQSTNSWLVPVDKKTVSLSYLAHHQVQCHAPKWTWVFSGKGQGRW